MRRFAFLLLLNSLPSSSFASSLLVYTDAAKCVNLRCEWRGSGEHCKPSKSLDEAYEQDICGRSFEFLTKVETDAELLSRIKRRFPVNTFTIVNDVALGEMCEKKRLCCNAALVYHNNDYEEFLTYLLSPVPDQRPKLQC